MAKAKKRKAEPRRRKAPAVPQALTPNQKASFAIVDIMLAACRVASSNPELAKLVDAELCFRTGKKAVPHG